MNSKILWSEADRIHRMITKPLKNGRLQLNKTAQIDVDKVPQASFETKDKVVEGALYIMSAFGFLICTIFLQSMIYGMCIMLIGILVSMRLAKKRTIIYPFFFAKWNACTPFDITKKVPMKSYKVSEKVEIQKKEKDGTIKKGWKTISGYVREIGTLDFFELKMDDKPNEGIPMYTPQDMVKLDKQSAMREIIKGEHAEKMNLPLLIIVLILGLMLGLYVSPILTQYMTQAAAPAAQGAASGVVTAPH